MWTALFLVVGAWACFVLLSRAETEPFRVWLVFGSGGHTTELLEVTKRLDFDAVDCTCVLADTDHTTVDRALNYWSVNQKLSRSYLQKRVHWKRITRIREVGASFVVAVLRCLCSTLALLPIVWRDGPNLLLLNGPGTCLPVAAAVLIVKALTLGRRRHCKVVFIESFCRVKSISITGAVLKPLVDRFYVHWEGLEDSKARAFRPPVFL